MIDEFVVWVEVVCPLGALNTWMLDLSEDGPISHPADIAREIRSTLLDEDMTFRETLDLIDSSADGYKRSRYYIEASSTGVTEDRLIDLFLRESALVAATLDEDYLVEQSRGALQIADAFVVLKNPFARDMRVECSRAASSDEPPWKFEYELTSVSRPEVGQEVFEVTVHDVLGLVRSRRWLTPG